MGPLTARLRPAPRHKFHLTPGKGNKGPPTLSPSPQILPTFSRSAEYRKYGCPGLQNTVAEDLREIKDEAGESGKHTAYHVSLTCGH